jgi:hypothetical protein
MNIVSQFIIDQIKKDPHQLIAASIGSVSTTVFGSALGVLMQIFVGVCISVISYFTIKLVVLLWHIAIKNAKTAAVNNETAQINKNIAIKVEEIVSSVSPPKDDVKKE